MYTHIHIKLTIINHILYTSVAYLLYDGAPLKTPYAESPGLPYSILCTTGRKRGNRKRGSDREVTFEATFRSYSSDLSVMCLR